MKVGKTTILQWCGSYLGLVFEFAPWIAIRFVLDRKHIWAKTELLSWAREFGFLISDATCDPGESGWLV
jgi:hypothetical protein